MTCTCTMLTKTPQLSKYYTLLFHYCAILPYLIKKTPKIWARNGRSVPVWPVYNRANDGTEKCNKVAELSEYSLQTLFLVGGAFTYYRTEITSLQFRHFWKNPYPACSSPCMLLICCWSSACCCISGRAAPAWYCANFWARDSLLSIGKSAGKPEGRAEENDGGAPARLGVAMENMGVDRLLLSPGVCMGKLFRDITGVDRGWSCPEAPVIPCRLGCKCRKERTKLANRKGELLSIVLKKVLL